MARRELSPAQLAVVQAVRPVLLEAHGAGLPVRIGCSGGADSLALTFAVQHVAERELAGLGLEAVVVDHGLQADSAQVSSAVVAQLSSRGLSTRRVEVRVSPGGQGVEAAAREARIDALTRDFAGFVGLGHSLDDQAETVLLGLARGSGTRSLAGMATRAKVGSAQLWRPLLGLRRAQLRQAALDWDAEIWDDPQNQEHRFTRVRVREVVLPVLEQQLGPQVAAALARTAQLARQDADALDAWAKQVGPQHWANSLPLAGLVELPAAVASRVLRNWLVANGVAEPGAGHVGAVVELVTNWHGQRGVDLPGGRRVYRQGRQLFI